MIVPLTEIPYRDAFAAVARIDQSQSESKMCSSSALKNNPKNMVLLAKVNEQYVGYIIAKPDYFHASDARISLFAVERSFQRQQVGTKLMEEAIDKVKKAGFSRLHINCRENAAPFYEKFAKRHQLPFSRKQEGFYGNGDKQFHFVYQILSDSSFS